ncbi:DUF551 domain-containing protein [Phytobacter sp. AG2a]
MEESRKQFEEAYWDEFGQFEDEERREVFSICECEGGSYYRLGTRTAWWAWQASRQDVTEDKWIPVSEQMPPDGEYVLCVDDEKANEHIPAHDDIYTAAWDPFLGSFTTKYWGDYDFLSKATPTHWHPLPGRSEVIRAAGLRIKGE